MVLSPFLSEFPALWPSTPQTVRRSLILAIKKAASEETAQGDLYAATYYFISIAFLCFLVLSFREAV
jgi:hypothetical protein